MFFPFPKLSGRHALHPVKGSGKGTNMMAKRGIFARFLHL